MARVLTYLLILAMGEHFKKGTNNLTNDNNLFKIRHDYSNATGDGGGRTANAVCRVPVSLTKPNRLEDSCPSVS